MKRVIRPDETIIIGAWGCLGKTTFAKNHPDIALDIESIHYNYIYKYKVTDDEKAKCNNKNIIGINSEYPGNYIKEVIKNIGKYKFIFITLARELFIELDKNDIKYVIVYPKTSRKQKIIEDAKKRGNNSEFIKMIDKILSSKEEYHSLKNNFKYEHFDIIEDEQYIGDYINEKYDFQCIK